MKFHTKILKGIGMFLLVVSTLQGVTLETYDNKIPESIKVDLRYKGEDLPEYLDYVFIKTKVGNVRKSATGTSMIILSLIHISEPTRPY